MTSPAATSCSVHRNLDGTGSIHGVFDDPAAFAAILTVLDARTRPSAENRGTTVAETQRRRAGRDLPVRPATTSTTARWPGNART